MVKILPHFPFINLGKKNTNSSESANSNPQSAFNQEKSSGKNIFISKFPLFLALLVLVVLGGLYLRSRSSGINYPASNLEQLRSLPYASSSNVQANQVTTGVTTYLPGRSSPGYNLFADLTNQAFLVDMQGHIVHQWTFPQTYSNQRIHHVEPLSNGQILGVVEERYLAQLDADSQVLWQTDIPAHHDIAVLDDGSILTPVVELKLYQGRIVKFDSLFHLSSQGQILDRWSTYAHLNQLKNYHLPSPLDRPNYQSLTGLNLIDWPVNQGITLVRKILFTAYYSTLGPRFMIHAASPSPSSSVSPNSLSDLTATPSPPPTLNHPAWFTQFKESVGNFFGLDKIYDYYHLNSIEVIPQNSLSGQDSRFQAGDLLLCFKNPNLIIILDKDTRQVVWNWGVDTLDQPHMPSVLPNGHILIFDNGANRGYSRILELDPTTKLIVWSYQADPPSNFFSFSRGSAQRLPNGNTLVNEANQGHVFEITPAGQTVWEFYNFNTTPEGYLQPIYRFIRYPRDQFDSWLE
jgi:hypothetical protein